MQPTSLPHESLLARWISLRIALAYAIGGAGWIVASDLLVSTRFDAPDSRLVQSYKGVGFVLTTALVLYLCLRYYLGRVDRATTALRRKEAAYQGLLNAIPDMILHVDSAGKILSCKPSKDVLPLAPPKSLIGRNLAEFSGSPEVASSALENIREALASGETQVREYTLTLENQTREYESRYARSLEGEVVIMIRDITDRRRDEEILRNREASFRLLFANNPQPMWVYDRETLHFLEVNEAATRHYGYSRDEFLALLITDIRPPDEAARLLDFLQINKSGAGQRGQWKHRLKNGTIIDVDIMAHTIDFDGRESVLIIAQDITARLRAEQELLRLAAERERQNAMLDTILSTTPDQFHIYDQQARYVYASPVALAAWGLSLEDVIGKTWADLHMPVYQAEQLSALLGEVFASGTPVSGTMPYWTISGAREYEYILNPARDKAGRITAAVFTLRDVTERNRAEKALRESEALLRSILAAMPDLLFRLNREGRYLEAYAGSEELLVEPLSTLIGARLQEALPPAVARLISDHTALALDTGRMQIFEYGLEVLSGYAEFEARLVVCGPDEVILIVRDITEQKKARIERERLLKQMEARANELATVAEVSLRVTTILDLDPLLWTIVNLTKENFNLYQAHIYLLDDDGKQLILAAGSGDAGRMLVAQAHKISVDFERSLVARAARTRQGVIANDVTRAGDYLPNPLLTSTRSEMAIPMVVGDELLGVLDVQAGEVNRFSPEDINVQTTLAAQVAIAIHNARLFAENARRLAIIESSNDLVALAPLEHRPYYPIYVNPAGLRLSGCASLEDFMSHPVAAFYPDEEARRMREVALPCALEQGMWRGESWLRRQDGSLMPIEQAVFVIRDNDGRPRDLATIASDITVRKQNEQALRKANRAYRTLSDCNQSMVRASEEKSLLDQICQIIVDKGGYRMAWVGIVEQDEGKTVTPVAHAGHEEGYLDQLQVSWSSHSERGQGITVRAVRTRQPQISRDIAHDPVYALWRADALARGYASAVTLPLLDHERVLGTLNVYASEVDAFDLEEIELLVELASDLAYGLVTLRTRVERQRVEEALRHLNIRLEGRNRQLVALNDIGRRLTATLDVDAIFRAMYQEIGQRLLGTSHFIVALYDEDTQIISCGFAILDGIEADLSLFDPYPLGEGPISQTILTQQPRILGWQEIEEQVRPHAQLISTQPGDERVPLSSLYVPMISSDKVIGVLNVQHYESNAFQEADITLLSVMANQAAIALRNAQLFAAERDQRILAEALGDTVAAVNSTLNFDEVLERILNNLDRVVPHDVANVMLLENGVARAVGMRGYTDGVLHEWVKTHAFVVADLPTMGEMIRTGKPLLIPNTQRDAEWTDIDNTRWVHSYVGAPILRNGEVIGFLNLDSHTPDFFTPEHARRLQAFTDQAAVAIHNAQLFAAERDQRTLAEALSQVAGALNSTLDLESVLDRILTGVDRVVPHDTASVMLIEDAVARTVRHRGFVERGLGEFISGLKFSLDDSRIYQTLVQRHQAVIVEDTQQNPDWIDLPETRWIRSYLAAPIVQGDELVGVLNLDSRQPGFFTARHAAHLQAFADQVAVAIQNARLYTATQQHAVELQAQTQRLTRLNRVAARLAQTLEVDQIFQIVLTETQQAVEADFGGLIIFEDEDTGRLVFGTHPSDAQGGNVTIPLRNNPSIEEVRRTHRSLTSEDVLHDPVFQPVWDVLRQRGTQSLVIVPLIVGNEVIGTIGLDSVQRRSYTEAQMELVETVASQGSIAISKAALFAAERDQRALAEALGDTAALINRTLNVDEVLDQILDNVGRVLPHDAANIMLIESGVARVVRGHGYTERGLDDWIRGLRFTVDEMPLWLHMKETRQPFAVPDTLLESVWLRLPEDDWIRSTVKAPIFIEHELIGILHLDSATPGMFKPQDALRLQAFADQAATAIQNAQLFAAERDQRTLAEALRDSAAAVNSTLDFREVLNRILANVGRIAAHDSATIMLIEGDTAQVVGCHPSPEEDERQRWVSHARFKLSETANLHRMQTTGQPVAIADTLNYPGWVNVPFGYWIRSQAAAPIKLDERVIGFLTLDSTEPGFFSQDHAERLLAFADQAAVAIENAQLYDAVQLHATDLERRVQARTAELETQRAQLQAILDAMGEGVIYSVRQELIYCNQAVGEMLGYSIEEMEQDTLTVYRSLVSGIGNYDHVMQGIQRAFEQHQRWRGAVRLRRRSGEEFDAALTATRVVVPEGQERGVVTVLRDISQEKALQAQKDRFIANASHELRTPLANVKTRLYLIRRQPEKMDQHLAVLERVADTMTDLIENLLDVSRFERGVIPLYRRTMDLPEIIQEVVTIQQAEAERKAITLSCTLPEGPLRVSADRQRLFQVITNLVINAINYTPEGGRIWVEVERQAGTPGQAVMRVRDTGIGIAPELLPHVFEAFFRANEGVVSGTGLGLTIAREIIQLHQGEISVESEPGQGSVFTIKLEAVEQVDQA